MSTRYAHALCTVQRPPKRLINFVQVVLSYMIQTFQFDDAGAEVSLKISSSLQPWTMNRKEPEPALPVKISLL